MHIYMYSDGLTEAMSENKELYGQARLELLVSRIHKTGVPLETIWPELSAFCGTQGLSDDAALIEISP
jgi:serine phosphatase RsbU (regulator of sigma subunit)